MAQSAHIKQNSPDDPTEYLVPCAACLRLLTIPLRSTAARVSLTHQVHGDLSTVAQYTSCHHGWGCRITHLASLLPPLLAVQLQHGQREVQVGSLHEDADLNACNEKWV